MFKIKGREVIDVSFTWRLEELYNFMRKHWDTAEYGDFETGKPTQASIEEYVLLPATEHCLVIAYPRKKKVIFSVADNPSGLKRMAASAIPTNNSIAKIYQCSLTFDRTKEMKGPAADICAIYAEYMKGLLKQEGLL